MIYGAHCYILTRQWTDASLPLLTEMRELGLACAEIAVGDDRVFDPELTAREAARLDMALVLSPGGEWPLHCDLSSTDVVERKAGVDWHLRQMRLAGEMGAVAYTGAAGRGLPVGSRGLGATGGGG